MTRHQTIMLCLSLLSCAFVSLFFLDIPVALDIGNTMPPSVVRLCEIITQLGEAWIWLALSGAAWLYCRRVAMKTPFLCRRVRALKAAAASAFLFAAVAASGIAADILKIIIGRPRPRLLREDADFTGLHFITFDAKHWSFPSGHVTTITAVACALSFFYPRQRVLFFLLALLIALSRIIVGAHYPSDVLGGAALGVLVTYELRRWWEAKYRLPFGRRAK